MSGTMSEDSIQVQTSPDGDMKDDYSRIVWQALNQSVLLTSVLYKLPQMKVIICSRSTASISLSSVVLELLAYTIILAYQFSKGYPAYTYYEQNLTVLQDFILVLLIMKRRYMIKAGILPLYSLYVSFFMVMCTNRLPSDVMMILINCTSPMLIWSKVNQLVTIWRHKSAGSMSSLTWFIAFYNTAARIIISMTVTRDLPGLINLVITEILNGSILLSLCYYTAKQAEQAMRRSRRRTLSRE